MKKCLSLVLIVIIASLVFISCSSSKESSNSTAISINQAIDTGSWTFTVSIIRPQTGPTRLPNGIYTFAYSPESLNVYLPYFGRSFGTADILSGGNPLNFISKDFEIKKDVLKKGKWRISIIPKDYHRQVQQFTFIIFENGSSSLDVSMTSRSPISYSGEISAAKN